MNDKQLHLEMLQKHIHSCGWHGLAMKVSAIVVIVAVLSWHLIATTTGYSGQAAANSMASLRGILYVADITGIIVILVLWLTDAHYHGKMAAYLDIFERVRMDQAPSDYNMTVPAGRKSADMVRAAWKSPIVYLYVGGICAVALLTYAA